MYVTYFSRDPVPLKESFAIQEKFSVEMWEISVSFPLKLQGKTETNNKRNKAIYSEILTALSRNLQYYPEYSGITSIEILINISHYYPKLSTPALQYLGIFWDIHVIIQSNPELSLNIVQSYPELSQKVFWNIHIIIRSQLELYLNNL